MYWIVNVIVNDITDPQNMMASKSVALKKVDIIVHVKWIQPISKNSFSPQTSSHRKLKRGSPSHRHFATLQLKKSEIVQLKQDF
jgi:hypothetical protein